MLGPAHAPVAVLAGDEAALAVDRVAVGMAGRMAKDADRIRGLVEAHHAVVGNVAPDQIAPGREIGGPFRPAAALRQLFQPRRSDEQAPEAIVEDNGDIPVHGSDMSSQWAIRTGMAVLLRIWLVAPPKNICRRRLWV